MPSKTISPIKAPSADAVYAASAMLRQMPAWRQALKPLLDAAARDIKSQSGIVPDLPKALNEFGRYCQLLGREIKQAQAERAQQAIAPAPQPARQPADGTARQVGSRRAGETSPTSPRPAGRPRKPARSD